MFQYNPIKQTKDEQEALFLVEWIEIVCSFGRIYSSNKSETFLKNSGIFC